MRIPAREIFDNISIFYKGIELTEIKIFKDFGIHLCDILDSEQKHTAALVLHTGSEFYNAVTITISALACLFENNTNIEELIQTLNIDDILLIDGQRVRFKGIKKGKNLGIGFKAGEEYFAYELSKTYKWVSLKAAKNLNIAIYQGESENLGGKGIKSTLKERKKFLEKFSKGKIDKQITTEISSAIAIIAEREHAEKLYKEIFVDYDGGKVALSELVTAAYYSENDRYQIGYNATKEEPILRFYSKISACREDIIEDNRFIGCICTDENVWLSNTEVHDIVDRKRLKFAILSGKTHLTNYKDWLDSEEYRYYVFMPEHISDYAAINSYSPLIQKFNREMYSFSERTLKDDNALMSDIDTQTVLSIKRKLLTLKNSSNVSQEKENFVIGAYFILNLCRSAIFPLHYCNIAAQNHILTWHIEDKINDLKPYMAELIGSNKEDAEYIYNNLVTLVQSLFYCNPKAERIKEKIIDGSVDAVVVTKAYYDAVCSLWLKDCGLSERQIPVFLTMSAFSKSESIYNNVIFTTPYYDFAFNPFACFGFLNAECEWYEYEQVYKELLRKEVRTCQRLLAQKNSIPGTIEPENEERRDDSIIADEATIESELEKMAKDLQLSGARNYLNQTGTSSETKIEIAKILTFASGNVGFFTKRYKAYRIEGEIISEVDLENLRIGDSLVFTKQSDNKDIVDVLLKQLLESQYKDTDYPDYYNNSLLWKNELKELKKYTLWTYQEIANALAIYGCKKHQGTIRTWLEDESHIVGPRDENDYTAIVSLTKMKISPEMLKRSCEEIRSLRIRILGLLGKAIIRGIVSGNDDPMWELIANKAEDLSQIEQITAIVAPESGSNGVSMYMINKPCTL